ncbi:MAG: sodium/proline symporter [Candidatus Thioglobus sp.]|nr:MAG: sodium/proline symporter [Candidatus Thioglobus sp.]
MLAASFITLLIIILLIGLSAGYFSRKTVSDYLTASQSISVWQTILSTLASAYSGFMYIGLIGYTYSKGVSGLWLMAAWMVGEFFIIRYIPEKISTATHDKNLLNYNSLLSNYWGNDKVIIKKVAAIITLVFLSIYAAAQFDAAGKAMNILLGWDLLIGIFVTYIMVLLYSFAGGIRASIWTDSIQFIIMLFSIALLVILGIDAIGGWGAFVDKLYQNPSAYTELFPQSMGNNFFIALFLFGWIAGGLGISGQPHVAVRFMAMKKTTQYKKILYGYYSLAIIFTSLCILSALIAKVYFADNLPAGFDNETILPTLAEAILPSALVGLMLAAIISSIISTADSQVLSCSSALGTDLLPQKSNDKARLMQNKLATIAVASFALITAIYAEKSVFVLTLVAWSGLASAFTPLLILQFMGYKISQSLGLVMMLSGLTAAVVWRFLGLNSIAYDAFVGILLGFCVFYLAQLFIKTEKQSAI